MVPTRRRVLGVGAALLAAVAGCNGTADVPSTDTVAADRNDRPDNVATDPPSVTLRRPASDDPPLEVRDADGERRTERERREAVRRGFVTSPEAASLLRARDGEGAARAREFVDETDFDAAFLFVDRGLVRRCFEQLLCRVTWSRSELRLTYAEVYRDYDVACSADERDRVARLIRLEGAVDPRRIESGGTHTRRGGCPVPRWRRGDRDERAAATAAEASDGGRDADATARLDGWIR
jgi:hypothetical protein